ncbi:MAG TPA: UDP-N-acetylmuramate:L-alanyl-gamma-D-glutamyl-meso-diaminopimelate ligase [Blastocatellia bacterium]|nr:UDP-N-acetylmuramate:L-alanyl-gamma-D-glutamyl-meso-diaminopimelate ligase [Blastocatellia bacterium]
MVQKHYHLIGICGTAMAGLAGLLKAAGDRVTGSDQDVYPPMSTFLSNLGIPVFNGYREENLQPHPDVVVVGNALSRGNPEVEYMLDAKLYYQSLPEVLKERFIRGRHSIVVAGTHGKTTTTSLAIWTMVQAGMNPSFLVGGIVENLGTSYQLTDSGFFVIEGDEYDTAFFDKGPKFVHYLPDTVILNSIEFDHADIYPDLEAVKTAFHRLLNLIPRRGRLIADGDSPVVRELAIKAWCPVEFFGLENDADWKAVDIFIGQGHTEFRVLARGETYGRFQTPLVGRFNVKNCLAVIALAAALGIPKETVAHALRSFRSVKRRMEVRGEVNGILLVDDFAHHPTAVRATLEALRAKYPGRRLIALFEPRSRTSRLRLMEAPYIEALQMADVAVLAPVFKPDVVPEPDRLRPEAIAAALQRQGKSASALDSVAAIVDYVARIARTGDVIVIMSNGGFGGIHEKLLARLQQAAPSLTGDGVAGGI